MVGKKKKSNEEGNNLMDIRQRDDKIKDKIQQESGGLAWLLQIELASERMRESSL